MCFDRDSLPPIPLISCDAVSHDDLVLEDPTANRLAATPPLAARLSPPRSFSAATPAILLFAGLRRGAPVILVEKVIARGEMFVGVQRAP